MVGVEDDFAARNKEEIVKLSDIYIKDFNEYIDLIDRDMKI